MTPTSQKPLFPILNLISDAQKGFKSHTKQNQNDLAKWFKLTSNVSDH